MATNASLKARWQTVVSLSGALVWAMIAALAGVRRAPFGIIELLFLFAPLVIVPLGLQLTNALDPHTPTRLDGLLRALQSVAALVVVISFWIPPGPAAAALSALWTIYCLLTAARRFAIEGVLSAKRWLPMFVLNIAALDLLLGSAWLVASRAGWRPMGFQEPIILLTAIHFHYSGFATAIIAAATLQAWERRVSSTRSLQVLVLFITLLPFVLATGFVFSPRLRFGAAIALSAGVIALACIFLQVAGQLRISTARIYLRAAAVSAFGALGLAGLYAFSEYFEKGWITIPAMANSHGVLNGLGFILMGLLAWNMELHSQDQNSTRPELLERNNGKGRRAYPAPSVRKPPTKAPLPEFVAREFYDH